MSDQKSPILSSLSFTDTDLRALDQFISQPDTRSKDVFSGNTITVSDTHHLEWLIKHDLFEGVVMQVSLMDREEGHFLAGMGQPLATAEDILDDFIFTWQDRPVILRVHTAL